HVVRVRESLSRAEKLTIGIIAFVAIMIARQCADRINWMVDPDSLIISEHWKMNDQLDDVEINMLADQGDAILELRERQQACLRDQDARKGQFRETIRTCNEHRWALALVVFLLAFGFAFVVVTLLFGGELNYGPNPSDSRDQAGIWRNHNKQ